MGKELEKVFSDRETLKEFTTVVGVLVRRVLSEADDMNATQPASASGKYHPIADLGKSGLIRHSLMVFEIGKILIASISKFDAPLERDVILAACLLHDICKYDSSKNKEGERLHIEFTHPVDAANLVRKVGKEMEDEYTGMENISNRIADLIATHHSRWNTNEKYAPGVELPLPETLDQRIVSFADLIAASDKLPDLMFKFREEAIREITNR